MNLFQKILIAPKVILKSSELIKNPYRALFDYLILRKPYIDIKLRNGSAIKASRVLYRRLLYWYYKGYIQDCNNNEIIFKIKEKTYSIPLSREINEYDIGGIALALENGWVYDNGYWIFNNIKFKHMYGPISEIFNFKEYDILDVKNKKVLDIGGFVGDSAIYFVHKGAKKVYSIEPHPDAYKEMLENIKLNNMEDKIVPINMGISYDSNYVVIDKDTSSTAGSFFRGSKKEGIKIPAAPLREIIKNYNIDAKVLKIDCEGCEYDIILKDYETIREFDQIFFEYHEYNTGISVKKLLKILSSDFDCKIVKISGRRINGTWRLVYCIKKH